MMTYPIRCFSMPVKQNNSSLFCAAPFNYCPWCDVKGIQEGDTLLFDMDGTLIDTDRCNTEAYKNAVARVLGKNCVSSLTIERIDRDVLRRELPDVAEEQLQEIIALKEEYYTTCLENTRVISSTMSILNHFRLSHKVILVTNARMRRTMQTLCYLHLEQYFDAIITKDDDVYGNKYLTAMRMCGLDPQCVWVFENELQQVNAAVAAGIDVNHIFLR